MPSDLYFPSKTFKHTIFKHKDRNFNNGQKLSLTLNLQDAHPLPSTVIKNKKNCKVSRN